MQAKLIVVGGKANKREVVLNLPATIGRSRDADLTVGHRMISRQHCEAYLADGVMMIRDAGSLNGTYVGGRRIREAPLLPGSKFTIGPITFRVSYEFSGDRSKLPPVVPAEPSSNGDAPKNAAPTGVHAPDDVTEPVKEPSKAKLAKEPPKPAPVPDDEPDFIIVEEEDDDFELALQEDLGEDFARPAVDPQKSKDNSKPKPAASKGDAEKDPEDELLDDFLNDVQ
ncbi:MAG TPA: FHA domain-containing protein [Thermoguttaceae bacterium]|nr:FHA domain-containing protein [Thermoguttaceae bacterium]